MPTCYACAVCQTYMFSYLDHYLLYNNRFGAWYNLSFFWCSLLNGGIFVSWFVDGKNNCNSFSGTFMYAFVLIIIDLFHDLSLLCSLQERVVLGHAEFQGVNKHKKFDVCWKTCFTSSKKPISYSLPNIY